MTKGNFHTEIQFSWTNVYVLNLNVLEEFLTEAFEAGMPSSSTITHSSTGLLMARFVTPDVSKIECGDCGATDLLVSTHRCEKEIKE